VTSKLISGSFLFVKLLSLNRSNYFWNFIQLFDSLVEILCLSKFSVEDLSPDQSGDFNCSFDKLIQRCLMLKLNNLKTVAEHFYSILLEFLRKLCCNNCKKTHIVDRRAAAKMSCKSFASAVK